MARSTYIYLVSPLDEVIPIAAFTVKHEAINWVERNHPNGGVELTRMRDGGDSNFISSRTLVQKWPRLKS